MPKMRTPYPARKVVASTAAAAIATILIWAINRFLLPSDPLPDYVGGAVLTLCAAITGYMVPPAPRDQIETTDLT